MENLNALFLLALQNQKKYKTVTAVFKDGAEVEYTTRVLKDLQTDADVVHIYDTDTGEILFARG